MMVSGKPSAGLRPAPEGYVHGGPGPKTTQDQSKKTSRPPRKGLSFETGQIQPQDRPRVPTKASLSSSPLNEAHLPSSPTPAPGVADAAGAGSPP